MLSGVVSSALDYKRSMKELEKLDSDIFLTDALAQSAHEEARVKSNQADSIAEDLPGKKLDREIDQSIIGPGLRLIDRINPLQWFSALRGPPSKTINLYNKK